MASNLDLYRREIFNFLRTVTIKFEPFAYLMGENYMNIHGIANPHGKWNPYYIHLSGEYTAEELASGDVMHVYTVEHESPEDVIFSKELKTTNPKTYELYKIPNDEYFHLEEQYSKYTGLLRCMVYPISNIDEAIAAPNLTLLAYDDSLLEINERESIVKCLKDFLDMVRTRWWIEEYTYEDMYAITFWGMLWQMLPMVLLGQRFKNIKTPYVHSFHVWEYLKSKGLNDYRDILTTNQSLWLYRNIDYILENKGKTSNLRILAENLLGEAYISLHYVDMQQDISNFENDLHALPQFIFSDFITDKETKINQLDDINPALFDAGLSTNNTPEYIKSTADELGTTSYNNLPTKYLEFKKNRIDTSAANMMTTFFLHSLMYRYSEGKLEYSVTVPDPYTGTKIKLHIRDMICLLYYVTCKSIGIEPTYIPTQVRVRVPYVIDKDSVVLTESIKYQDNTYRIDELVAVEKIMDAIPWRKSVFVSNDDFAEFINEQYTIYYFLFKQMEQSNKYLYHKALRRMLDDITVNKLIDVNLSTCSTYAEWLENTPIANNIIKQYDALANDTLKDTSYRTLSVTIYDTIFNTADSKYGVNTVKKMNSIYDAIRNLFISLCSYNITFIDSERDNIEYLTVEEPDFLVGLYTKEIQQKNAAYFNLIINIINYLSSDHFKYKLTMPLNDIEIQYTPDMYKVLLNFYKEIWIDFRRKAKMVSKLQVTRIMYSEPIEKSKTIRAKFVLHTGMDKACTKIEG